MTTQRDTLNSLQEPTMQQAALSKRALNKLAFLTVLGNNSKSRKKVPLCYSLQLMTKENGSNAFVKCHISHKWTLRTRPSFFLLLGHLNSFLVPQEYWCLSSLQAATGPQEKKSSCQIIKYYYERYRSWGFLLYFYFTISEAVCVQDSFQRARKSTNSITWTFGNAAPIKDSW